MKVIVMRMIHPFSNLHVGNLQCLNITTIPLFPKEKGTKALSDFTPISLIHGVAKIIV
jgi:hypothetical protein